MVFYSVENRVGAIKEMMITVQQLRKVIDQ